MKRFIFTLLTLSIALMTACGGDDGDKGVSASTDTDPSPCTDIHCSYTGSCFVNENNQPECKCKPGFHPTELACIPNDSSNPCLGVTCSGKGTCIINSGDPVCQCPVGYYSEGLACIKGGNSNPCSGVTCSDKGKCFIKNDIPSCNCIEGYKAQGTDCIEEKKSPCDGVTCSNHGLCKTNALEQAECECFEGYVPRGLECVEKPDPCKNITCSNHGKCVERENRIECDCEEGFIANGTECVEIEIDPCEKIECKEHETCNEGVCKPKEGYCNKKEDCENSYICINNQCKEDPCLDQFCNYQGDCIVENEIAVCKCYPGYHAEGMACVRNTPCHEISCSGNGKCVVRDGEAFCECEEGFYTEGLECKETVECQNDNDCSTWQDTSNNTRSHGICSNNRCICNPGRTGRACGKHDPCYDCDEEWNCALIECSGHGSCYRKNNEPACDCDYGYHARGLECVGDGECLTNEECGIARECEPKAESKITLFYGSCNEESRQCECIPGRSGAYCGKEEIAPPVKLFGTISGIGQFKLNAETLLCSYGNESVTIEFVENGENQDSPQRITLTLPLNPKENLLYEGVESMLDLKYTEIVNDRESTYLKDVVNNRNIVNNNTLFNVTISYFDQVENNVMKGVVDVTAEGGCIAPARIPFSCCLENTVNNKVECQ